MSVAVVEAVGGIVRQTVDIKDAKAWLSHLIARAEAGEEVIIARDGVPVARIVPVSGSIGDTIALMRRERGQRQRVSAADVRNAKKQGRS